MMEGRSATIVLCSLICILSLAASGGENSNLKVSPLRLDPTKTAYSQMNTDMPPWLCPVSHDGAK